MGIKEAGNTDRSEERGDGRMKRERQSGEANKYDMIRYILREYASREAPIGRAEIEKRAKGMGCQIGRSAIEGFMNEMMVRVYETEEECDEYIRQWPADEKEIIFCKTSPEGRRTRGYWMLESISHSEWMYLMDSVLYSKILTKKEADDLAHRITLLAGRKFSELTQYRHRMEDQPFLFGNDTVDGRHIESRVLRQVYLIRKAIMEGKKVKFHLNEYQYGNQEIRLVPYGRWNRICSPFEVVYANGRYYMLGADQETERREDLKYKLYRIDLMTDVAITRANAMTKEESGIGVTTDLFQYRIENPYMCTGESKIVRFRVDRDQFTRIVDQFGDQFRVTGYDANEESYYDIEMKMNVNSFLYWALSYSDCVTVLEKDSDKKEGENSFRNQMKERLEKALGRYESEV